MARVARVRGWFKAKDLYTAFKPKTGVWGEGASVLRRGTRHGSDGEVFEEEDEKPPPAILGGLNVP